MSAGTLLALPGASRGPRGARAGHASSAARRLSARPQRLRATYEALAARGVADRVQLDLGLLRDLGYYTGAILEVYDPALGHILGGGGRYDELMGRFGRAAAGGRLRAVPGAAARRPGRGGAARGRSGARARAPLMPRLVSRPIRARGAMGRRARSSWRCRAARSSGGDARPARPGRARDRRASLGDSRSLVFETGGLTLVTMRPSDVPTYVEAGRRRPRDHRQGRAARAAPIGPSTSSSTSATGPAGWCSPGVGATRASSEAERRLGRDADRDQVPADRRAPLRGDRSPGRGDRGQGLGRAGAARRPRRRDRRPGRHRPHAGRERARGARGDRRLHRPAGRQPGRPQAPRRRGRRLSSSASREAARG